MQISTGKPESKSLSSRHSEQAHGVFATDEFGGGNAIYKWPGSGLNA